MPRILVTPSVIRCQPGKYKEILEGAGMEVVFPSKQVPEGIPDPGPLLAELKNIDGVLAGSEMYTPAVFAASKLRAIARMGVGYDAIDIASACAHRVAVTIAPGTNEQSVAELTIALILAVYRGIVQRHAEVHSGKWQRAMLPRLGGKLLGIVGLGRIGRAVVPKAKGLGLSVIAHDPMPNTQFAASESIPLVSLEELLEKSDIVSLHLPCTAENTDLINAKTLARMKPGAVLINTARGGLVNEIDLAQALASGHLFGAGLDAYKKEPLSLDSPLLKLNNVTLTPHMGGLDDESNIAMSSLAAQCIVDLYQGKWPEECVVNRQIRDNYRW